MERVRKISETYPVFKNIQSMTNNQVKPEYILIALAAVLLVTLFCKTVAGAITNVFMLILIINPCTSLIISKTAPDAGTMKHVLSYLLCAMLVVAVESILRVIIRKIPFYYHAKFIFFYYLSVRRTQLTEYINTTVVVGIHDGIQEINKVQPKDVIKAAQSAATQKIKNTIERTQETESPKKEE
ncbi:hypothetical protein NEIG_01803 [Nematocida sp. ERTm5]|nr:hypothetical protein NEIRO02_1442 [Nematocida sp. AWRm79]KAI5187895.1 hypothetical protein NEIRO03_2624 [Nematocida sp. AWRm78]OAG33318.1 hypothetical protein NEIG_01803 [Nematocida sp. ERTm5]